MSSPAKSTFVELDIGGMTCASCAARVEKKLNRMPGVEASVNYATERAVVQLPAGTSVEQAIATVVATGYSAAQHHAGQTTSEDTQLLKRRVLVTAALAIPVTALSMVPILQFTYWQWVAFALTIPVVTWGAWPFHKAALINARHGNATMDTLVSLGVSAAFLWSVASLIWGGAGGPDMRMTMSLLPTHDATAAGMHELYFEVAAAVTFFLLLGRYWEAKAKDRGREALTSLHSLAARSARVVRNGQETEIPVDQLVVGDEVRVRPGERIPADGEVVSGSAAVDTSFLTGESIPVPVTPGSTVPGAGIVSEGSLLIRVTAVGSQTRLSQLAALLERAQSGKAPVQRLADRVSAVFVPIVILLALVTIAGWWIITGSAQNAFTAGIAVLIIACPCALGLATPTALLVGTGRGAQMGILIRGPEVLESTKTIDTIVLDKTGTVTSGALTVNQVDIAAPEAMSADSVIDLLTSVERLSEHPVAQAIVAHHGRLSANDHVMDFVSTPGMGVTGRIDDQVIRVGRPSWLSEHGVSIDLPSTWTMPTAGSVILGAINNTVVARWVVTDQPRPDSAEAVKLFVEMGITPLLVTGDQEASAQSTAERVGITEVFADVTPAGKAEIVTRLRNDGNAVAMVGDGINDAAALATANLGIAMGSGTDIAREASDITVLKPSLVTVADAIRLSRRTLAIIKGNLFWAFAYNVAAIPLAMAGLLNPLIAGAAMAFSSVFVVSNSLRLRSFQPTPVNSASLPA